MSFIKSLLFYCILSMQLYSQSPMISGVDVSFLKQIEDNNGIYKENGVAVDGLQIFKNHGVNYVRLRLWNNPTDGYINLTRTIQMAKRIKQKGMQWLLDFHYSDTWADPGHQTKPAAWVGLSVSALKDSVYAYTKSVLLALKQENVLPDMVQIGNEITGGFLWDEGRVGGSFNSATQWTQFTDLLKKGLLAVQEMNTASSSIKTMVHVDTGGDTAASKWFFDNLLSKSVQFDYIGLSYYPWWHGNLLQLTANLAMLSARYGKDIIVAETAYPWTLQWYDNTGNVVGTGTQLLPDYPATPEGQRTFLKSISAIVSNVPSHKGIGFFYWEPGWISTPTFGSGWENLAVFDFSGNALGAITSFNIVSAIDRENTATKTFSLQQNYPNPFNPSTKIEYSLPVSSKVSLNVFSLTGEVVAKEVDAYQSAGTHSVDFNAKNLANGMYIYRITAGGFIQSKKMIVIK